MDIRQDLMKLASRPSQCNPNVRTVYAVIQRTIERCAVVQHRAARSAQSGNVLLLAQSFRAHAEVSRCGIKPHHPWPWIVLAAAIGHAPGTSRADRCRRASSAVAYCASWHFAPTIHFK